MSENQLATRPNASEAVAAFIGMDRTMMLDTFRAQCFKNANSVSDSQLAAFVSIARDMGVNPLLPGMLYAYPTSGGGIVPMMGPDGVYKKLMEHPAVESWQTTVYPEDGAVAPTHATTEIFLKNREHSIKYTAYLSEWRVTSNPNWGSRPRHMLGLRSLKQAARQVIHGLPYDEDDKTIGDLINVTPVGESGEKPEAEKRQAPPKRETRGVAAATSEKATKKETTVAAVEVVTTPVQDGQATQAEKSVTTAGAPLTGDQTSGQSSAGQQASAASEPVNTVEPLTSIEKDKKVTLNGVEVVEVVVKEMKTSEGVFPNTVVATVKGAFVGTVYHLGGGNRPFWKAGNVLQVTLFGKGLKGGKTAPMVEAVAEDTITAGSDLELS